MEPITFHHATCATLPGIAFRRLGRWLFLPIGAGPLHVVQPDESLMLQGQMPLSMHPFVQRELATRVREEVPS